MLAFAIVWAALAAVFIWTMERGVPRLVRYLDGRGDLAEANEAALEARIQADQQRIDELERRISYTRAELRRLFPRGIDAKYVLRAQVQALLDDLENEAEWRSAS